MAYIRACPDVTSLCFTTIKSYSLLQLAGELVYFPRTIRGVVGHAGELLRVWPVFRARGKQGRIRRVTCRDELDMVRGEGEVHRHMIRE